MLEILKKEKDEQLTGLFKPRINKMHRSLQNSREASPAERREALYLKGKQKVQMKNQISFIPGFASTDCTFKPETNNLSKKIVEKVKYQSPEVRSRLNHLLQE